MITSYILQLFTHRPQPFVKTTSTTKNIPYYANQYVQVHIHQVLAHLVFISYHIGIFGEHAFTHYTCPKFLLQITCYITNK